MIYFHNMSMPFYLFHACIVYMNVSLGALKSSNFLIPFLSKRKTRWAHAMERTNVFCYKLTFTILFSFKRGARRYKRDNLYVFRGHASLSYTCIFLTSCSLFTLSSYNVCFDILEWYRHHEAKRSQSLQCTLYSTGPFLLRALLTISLAFMHLKCTYSNDL